MNPSAPFHPPSEVRPRSRWHRRGRSRTRAAVVAGALGAVLLLGYTVAEVSRPHPDAVLHPIGEDADGVVLSLLGFLGADAEPSSIRGYEPYRGFEPWFSVERQGLHCLMLVDRSTTSVDGANCVPPGVDLFADIGMWPEERRDSLDRLPDGSIVRFHYRGNSVDVFVYPATHAG